MLGGAFLRRWNSSLDFWSWSAGQRASPRSSFFTRVLCHRSAVGLVGLSVFAMPRSHSRVAYAGLVHATFSMRGGLVIEGGDPLAGRPLVTPLSLGPGGVQGPQRPARSRVRFGFRDFPHLTCARQQTMSMVHKFVGNVPLHSVWGWVRCVAMQRVHELIPPRGHGFHI